MSTGILSQRNGNCSYVGFGNETLEVDAYQTPRIPEVGELVEVETDVNQITGDSLVFVVKILEGGPCPHSRPRTRLRKVGRRKTERSIYPHYRH